MKIKTCIISEGSYPIVRGGVSNWTNQLISALNSIDFQVFCLAPNGKERSVFEPLPNLTAVAIHGISQLDSRGRAQEVSRQMYKELGECLSGVLTGNPIDCEHLGSLLRGYPPTKAWLRSREYWDYVVDYYQKNCPDCDFSEFFWTLHGIFASLLDTLSLVQTLPRADIYHSLTTGIGGFVGSMARVLNGSPLIVSEHGLYLKEREIDLSRQDISSAVHQQLSNYYQALVKTCYQYATFLIPICRNYAESEFILGAAPEKVRVITNGVDCTRFTPPLTRDSTIPVVGCFARVVPVKDQITLIRASKKVLERHPAYFVFVGEIQDNQYYLECRSLVSELGLNNRVKFIGHAENVADWYRLADVFVLSSQSEGVPLALLEAMSCGLPAVCTAVGGIPDILGDTGAGYIVAPGDADGIGRTISELLADRRLRASIGVRARDLVKDKYTIEQMTTKIQEVYEEAIHQRF